jgi:PKD repeat protein
MTASKFPAEFDNDENLFLVRDSLRLRLLEDYNPGDTSIQVEGDPVILLRWPSTGQLTLTEQCSDIESRAINLSFTSIDPVAGVISGLEIVPGFTDSLKPKRITDVTINVIADHHNNIKDAVIAIEEFVGVKGTTDIEPFGDTLEGRTNFLRNLVLQPKAWFSSNVRVGIVPLEVEFQDLSFRLITDNGGIGDVVLLWDFGDNTTSNISMLSHISVIDEVPGDSIDVLVYDVDGGKVKKTYLSPGIYDVKLTVSNKFGDDECIFPEFIHARPQAPRPAVIRYREKTDTQTSEPGDPENGPFITPPTIRSPINTLIDIEIESGENFATPGYSFAGEQLSGGNPIDPIATYTWVLGDDLIHSNAPFTKGSYSVGGIYDLKLRVDTTFGAYRITTYENSIDIIENENLWLWVFSTPVTVRSYEYGLISESFKTNSSQTLAVVRDASFLDAATIPESTREQQIKEFKRNNGFCQRSTTNSGQQGTAILYWASGRSESDAVSTEKINLAEFNGFLDTYLSLSPISRPWNWVSFNAPSAVYFVFGRTTTDPTPFTSPTNPTRTRLELGSLNVNTAYQMLPENFSNNAVELLQNPAFYYQADQTPPSGFST